MTKKVPALLKKSATAQAKTHASKMKAKADAAVGSKHTAAAKTAAKPVAKSNTILSNLTGLVTVLPATHRPTVRAAIVEFKKQERTLAVVTNQLNAANDKRAALEASLKLVKDQVKSLTADLRTSNALNKKLANAKAPGSTNTNKAAAHIQTAGKALKAAAKTPANLGRTLNSISKGSKTTAAATRKPVAKAAPAKRPARTNKAK